MNRLSRKLSRKSLAGFGGLGISRTKSRNEEEFETGLRKKHSLGRRLSRKIGVEDLIFSTAMSDEERFMKEMEDIVNENALKENTRSIFDPPYEVLDEFLYLGTANQARDISQIQDVGITHVINFQPNHPKNDTSAYSMEKAGIKYLEFDCKDDSEYNMTQHFADCYRFIEEARTDPGAKILLYSVKGINTAGFMSVAYTLVHKRLDLLAALRLCAEKRGIILLNSSFREQLYHFAKDQGALDFV
mmetsp:Transcript_158/g.204  ORF Transcript_158/g.204 Transcript_158/m.204 type:complete len:245 (+) Transcript_158:407-1141(+)|eukprot:CAMPEP_0184036068 /NCGR_PEP_ID=MMETSP0955-20130417/29704_1 /TAXON_ID=627963 /ORGANISM="Aplanochytrium sp, Strain PBS07" /LENGTH=244 /DNA_ID=CAMNT_0026323503 /DNA_START=352 /DNA_END=1086 /DNA_ORIENTATION=-